MAVLFLILHWYTIDIVNLDGNIHTISKISRRQSIMATNNEKYPASLDIDYPKKLDRVSSFFRIIWAIPIIMITALISASGSETTTEQSGRQVTETGGGIAAGLFMATALMILFRQRYPKWWFNFNLEFNRFTTRVAAYILLLTDKYPSTEDEQSVHLNLEFPNVEKDLNRWLPLVKWFLAIPHYFVLIIPTIGAILATIIAWFAILFTGRYPKGLFDFVVGVSRWQFRVTAYAFLLTTDKYPPFSLK